MVSNSIKVIRSIDEMMTYSGELKSRGRRIGLVPTMGYLHKGHLSLMEALDGKCDVKAASIFVNPIQFAPGEDFQKYPRDEEADLAKLKESGCELVFSPSNEEMYPDDFSTYVEENVLSKGLCGKYRPSHFRGVVTVVLRLFNITRCDAAAFGLKDYQQAMVIKRMVRDLNVPVELVFGKTVRESDGVAMSSRNAYLSQSEREQARVIPEALKWAQGQALAGRKNTAELRQDMLGIISRSQDAQVQYIEFIKPDSFQRVEQIKGKAQVAVAVYIGKTRLIDNLEIGPESNSWGEIP